jgi:hypothetical protein
VHDVSGPPQVGQVVLLIMPLDVFEGGPTWTNVVLHFAQYFPSLQMGWVLWHDASIAMAARTKEMLEMVFILVFVWWLPAVSVVNPAGLSAISQASLERGVSSHGVGGE